VIKFRSEYHKLDEFWLVGHIIEPNIRFPLVSIRLTAITDSRKKIRPRKEVRRRHLHRHFLSCFMRLERSSERGTSRVKSASGRPPGLCEQQMNFSLYNFSNPSVTFNNISSIKLKQIRQSLINSIIQYQINIMGRITTPLLKLPITKVVIKINIKRYRFMQL
jgi:hypothetical protein